MNFTLDSYVQRVSSDVAETELDGNIVLMHIEYGKYYSFNNTSSDLWRWLESKCLITDLVTKLCAKYSCTKEQATNDLVMFLQQLSDLKLLNVL